MCGGIVYNMMKIPKKELKKFYDDKEIARFEESGKFESYFWSQKPVLPIEKEGKVELKSWGNRDKDIELPKTGWAKVESIEAGKWKYLNPKPVSILADRGYEKGVWFETKKGEFKGLLINKDKNERVYMITKPADKNYLELTKHNREPVDV